MAKKNTPSKSTADNKKASSTKARKPAANKKTVAAVSRAKRGIPTHEEISQKAHEIYLERISKGEPGNPDSDWQQALDILQA